MPGLFLQAPVEADTQVAFLYDQLVASNCAVPWAPLPPPAPVEPACDLPIWKVSTEHWLQEAVTLDEVRSIDADGHVDTVGMGIGSEVFVAAGQDREDEKVDAQPSLDGLDSLETPGLRSLVNQLAVESADGDLLILTEAPYLRESNLACISAQELWNSWQDDLKDLPLSALESSVVTTTVWII